MTTPTSSNGKICYIEMPSTDIAGSAAFYKAVFGWDIRTRGDGATAFDDGVGQVSGVWTSKLKAVADPGMIVYIMVDDIEKTMEAVVAQGGKIVQPIGMHAPELTAHFTDPSGNRFGLYQEPRR